jgi:hypothetical protein
MGTDKKCEYCDKRGVPILPLRYAVVPAGAGAPVAEGPAIKLPYKAAHYTRRLLRAGYLYIFDEARNRWEVYYVTPESHFFRIAETPGIPPVLPKKPFDCPDEGHRALASCITIPDARNATKVWLGFSDTQWTKAVRDKHADAAYRKRHMRCVDVKSFAASADAVHCIGIHTVGTHVLEHALDASAGAKAAGWSPFAVNTRKDRTERLIQQCENLHKGKGFAVTLEDPAGVATELGALMQRNLDLFVKAKVRQRELAVANAIDQIEMAVREQALFAEEQAAESLANGSLGQPDIGMLFSGYRDKKLKQIEELRTVTAAEAKRAGDEAWSRYKVKFDEPAWKKWKADFNSALTGYDADFISPLAVKHRDWMESTAMGAYFECCYDSNSADSGVVYAKTVQLCIGGTQDKAACFDLYTKWLLGDVNDKKNLILGALTLNLEKTRQEIADAAKVNLDWRGIPWDGVIGNFGKATERVAAHEADALGRIVAQLGGPIAKMLGEAVNGPVRHAVVALGMVSGHPIVKVEVTGGKKAFRALLIRELTKLSGTPMNARQMERAVSAELRRLEVYGMNLSGTEKKQFLLMVDPEQVAKMPRGLNPNARAQWLASSIRTPADVESLNLSSWKAKVANPAGLAVRGSVPFIFGTVAALLQYKAYEKLTEDEGKAMTHERGESTWRLRAGMAAMAGTISELVGTGVEKIAPLLPRLGQGIAMASGRWLVLGGRLLGLGGALVMATWDLQQGASSLAEKNFGAGVAYFASAVLGLGAALCILIGWTGVGLILVALLMAVAVLIEYLKDNKIQDWLERCVWGNLQHYKDLETEMRELKLAAAS